jgi:hypothetical protein
MAILYNMQQVVFPIWKIFLLSFEWKWQKLLVLLWQTFGSDSAVERKEAQLTETCGGPVLCSTMRYSATSRTRKIVAD